VHESSSDCVSFGLENPNFSEVIIERLYTLNNFLEQARAAPDQVLVRQLLAAVTVVCADGAPVRAPGRSERMAAGEARRGRWEAAVRCACEGEQYHRLRGSSMSSRRAAECAAMVLHEPGPWGP